MVIRNSLDKEATLKGKMEIAVGLVFGKLL